MSASPREEDPRQGEGVSPGDLDAHRQVLEMARTIEVLQRDYELMQKELLAAYDQLRERSTNRRGAEDGGLVGRSRASLGLRGDDASCCSRQQEIDELRKLIEVKDVALAEALEQRNQHRVELEKAETLVRELRALHLETLGGRNSTTTKTARSPSRSRHLSCAADSGSTSRVPATLSASALLGAPSTVEVPHTERFDQESTYHRKENDSLFWRKQYREAVRMRKKPSLVSMTQPSGSARSGVAGSSKSDAKPSLRIFSAPNTQRQRIITDECVPFSRYIGISARQHEIIKEQHRILS